MSEKWERDVADSELGIHEALHSAHIAQCTFHDYVAQHPAVALRPDLKVLADLALERMGDVYQAIGRLSHVSE